MTKKNINRLKKAIDNCIANAETLLWGSDTDYPTDGDIVKANQLLEMAMKIDDIIAQRA